MLSKKLEKEIRAWCEDLELTNPDNYFISGGNFEEDAYLLFQKVLRANARKK